MELHDDVLYDGQRIQITYRDADSFTDLPAGQVRQHYGVCFCGGKVVLCFHPNKADGWALPGGKPEPGESFEETLAREVQEESNMRILRHRPIGYQVVTGGDGKTVVQLRSFCVVEPIGPFVKDPAGAVTKIELVAPEEVNKYLKWGAIGDRVVERAVSMEKDGAGGDATRKAGGLIVSQDDPTKIALVFRASLNDWSFPKGHVDPGETAEETAVREAYEETGLRVSMVKEMVPLVYTMPSKGKTAAVRMFLMKSEDDSTLKPEHPGDRLAWLSPAEAREKLSYENLKEWLAGAEKYLAT